MSKLNNLSLKSLVLITFLIGVLTGGALFFSLNYSPPAEADDQIEFKTEAYKDVVRFEVVGGNVSKVQVEIYDLSGRPIYKGETTSQALDWHRTSDNGARLTKGTYMYVTKAYSGGNLIKTSGIGKMFISSEFIQLQPAPSLESLINSGSDENPLEAKKNLPKMAVTDDHSDESWAFGQVGIGTTNPQRLLHVEGGIYFSHQSSQFVLEESDSSIGSTLRIANQDDQLRLIPVNDNDGSLWNDRIHYDQAGDQWVIQPGNADFTVESSGRVGVGTRSPSSTLEVQGSESNLFALYNSSVSTTDAKFRVENDGSVRADGTYYGTDFQSGGADVAERINTSEWVKKGNVVEIDPNHEGFFRKTRDSYSTKVAGVISSNPGLILGSDKGSSSDRWGDNRPKLVLAGRVEVKVNTNNGSIDVGDLLVSSSQPGYAMKCEDRRRCTGAVVGKALEPLKEKSGKVMIQVTLS